MNFNSEIRLKGTKNDLEPYYNALKPEEEETNRAKYTVEIKPKELLIKIEAKDSTALRAMTNSITGVISIVDKTKNGRFR